MNTIFELIDADDSDGIRALLAAHPEERDARNDAGLSPLMHAAYRGCGATFEAIVESGEPTDPWERVLAGRSNGLPDPDAWSPDGFTPLHIAAFVDNVPGAAALLEAGADPNVVAKAELARVTPLGTCAFAGALGVAKVLLENGADPHIGEDGEYTVEAEAIARGNAELIALIEGVAA